MTVFGRHPCVAIYVLYTSFSSFLVDIVNPRDVIDSLRLCLLCNSAIRMHALMINKDRGHMMRRHSLYLHHSSCHNSDNCRWAVVLPISWHIVHTFCSTFDNSGNFSVAEPPYTTDTVVNSNSPTMNSCRTGRPPMVDECNWHLCIRHPDSMHQCRLISHEYDQLNRRMKFRIKLVTIRFDLPLLRGVVDLHGKMFL